MQTVEEKDYKNLISFLLASIADMQAVIRAADTKASAILVILSIPLTKFDVIASCLLKAIEMAPFVAHLVGALFIFSWCVGFYTVSMTLMAIDNPLRHINGASGEGTFYCSDLYHTLWKDSFKNRSCLLSRLTWESHTRRLPMTDKAIYEELAFEQMKLSYIRSIKFRRIRTSYFATLSWIVTGAFLWLLVLPN
jgi:hypothetical protein